MVRFPGGCLTHDYDWKKAIGPVSGRPNFAFGVDEYMAFCKAVGAEPLMSVADYVGGPQDAADLVEYLNAPADAAHPWAKKRAANGHPAPYKVVYFEMGNESDHGNHDVVPHKQFSPEQYVEWVATSAKLMRKIDPSIKIGAATATTFPNKDVPWNEVVLKGLKDTVDFVIVHTYSVQVVSPATPVGIPAEKLMRAAMASVEQFEAFLAEYRGMVRKLTGKALPLAITEYNAMYVQQDPVPYRFTLGGALFSADYLRVLMQPGSDVLMANYWQFSNGYWGFARSDLGGFKTQPAFYLFRLWAKHFGSRLVSTAVDSPAVEFEGGVGVVAPSKGTVRQAGRNDGANLLNGVELQSPAATGVKTGVGADASAWAEIDGLSSDAHLPLAKVAGPRGAVYRVSFQARSTAGLGKATLGLSVIDSRGWEPYHSGMAVEGVEQTREWRRFEGVFSSLDDSPGALLAWRILPHGVPVSGRFEIRRLKVTAGPPPSFPAYKAVTACSSLSSDGKRLYVMLFNKHHDRSVTVTVKVSGFAGTTTRRWTVTGPKLESTNLGSEEVRETVSGEPVALTAGTMKLELPPGSMTAVEVGG